MASHGSRRWQKVHTCCGVLYRPAPHTVGTHTDPLLDATCPTGHTSATGATHPDKNAVPASLNLPAGHGKHALRFACPASGW